MARSKEPRLNLLGLLAILVGAAALVALKVPGTPLARFQPTHISFLGIGIGLLALMAAKVTGRWGTGYALLGLIISATPLVLIKIDDGTLPAWWAKMQPSTPAAIPAVARPGSATPNPAPAAPVAEEPHQHSIFDAPGTGGSDNSSHAGPPKSFAPASPAVMAQHPPVEAPLKPAGPTVEQARANVDAATAVVSQQLATDPAYTQAQKDVADADARRQAALASDGPGSAAVLEASNQWLQAKTKLRKLLDAATSRDPAVAAAQRQLRDAEAASRGAK